MLKDSGPLHEVDSQVKPHREGAPHRKRPGLPGHRRWPLMPDIPRGGRRRPFVGRVALCPRTPTADPPLGTVITRLWTGRSTAVGTPTACPTPRPAATAPAPPLPTRSVPSPRSSRREASRGTSSSDLAPPEWKRGFRGDGVHGHRLLSGRQRAALFSPGALWPVRSPGSVHERRPYPEGLPALGRVRASP